MHSGPRRTQGSPRSFGLDAVRAVAIALVLSFHFGAVCGGWLGWQPPLMLLMAGVNGVQLFFVLSGLLIGTIMLGNAEQGFSRRAWCRFMLRRWLRTDELVDDLLASANVSDLARRQSEAR